MRRITVNLSDSHFQGLEKLQTERGFLDISEALRYAVFFTIKKEFPDYVEMKKNIKPMTVEDKIDASLEMNRVKAERKTNEQKAICDLLGGTVIDINGHLHCDYPQYTELAGGQVTTGQMVEPLDALSDQSIKYQFRDVMGSVGPDAKEKIIKLLNK